MRLNIGLLSILAAVGILLTEPEAIGADPADPEAASADRSDPGGDGARSREPDESGETQDDAMAGEMGEAEGSVESEIPGAPGDRDGNNPPGDDFERSGTNHEEKQRVTGPTGSRRNPEPHAVRKKKAAATRPKKRYRYSRGKEIQGTKALDRFESDTVIESFYNLNGRSLEVDPD